ncbi:MAG: hypothetical protein NT018_04090 [Armatimonadetes bacterium]|nr:hypothetical protein [Armatimonadota bacterium]
MAELKTGNGVMIKTREVTPEDIKSGLYFLYFGGLVGKVDRIYDDGSVCIEVDIDSLSKEARSRHLAMQEAERRRWLENLSGEARNRLTPEQRQLRISYKLLVSKKDLEPHKGFGIRIPKQMSGEQRVESGEPVLREPQHGEVEPAHGEVEPQHGEVEPQHGEVEPQHGEVEPQHGEVEPQHGEVEPAHGEAGKEVDNEEEPIKRPTEADLEAREEEFLKSLQEKQ